jgi:hypothetical protein
MKRNLTAVLATAVMLTTGCESGTGPAAGSTATLVVAVRGDSPEGGAAAWSPAGFFASQAGSDARVEVTARVWVQTTTGQWVELTRGAARQTVQASGEDGAKLLATSRVEAERYRRMRVEFERVEAHSESGLQVSAGVLIGAVRVDLGGDGSATVEREVSVAAEANSTTTLEIDLNSDQWLRRADAESRTVTEAEFESAVRVAARR